MKALYIATAIALLASPVYAQQGSSEHGSMGSSIGSTSGSSGSPSNTMGNKSSSSPDQASMAQKIKSDLQSAGFKDVNVVAESFAVTAKSKDGNPVYMTFGPESMSVMETVGTVPNKNSSSSSQSSSGSQSNQK